MGLLRLACPRLLEARALAPLDPAPPKLLERAPEVLLLEYDGEREPEEPWKLDAPVRAPVPAPALPR